MEFHSIPASRRLEKGEYFGFHSITFSYTKLALSSRKDFSLIKGKAGVVKGLGVYQALTINSN